MLVLNLLNQSNPDTLSQIKQPDKAININDDHNMQNIYADKGQKMFLCRNPEQIRRNVSGQAYFETALKSSK